MKSNTTTTMSDGSEKSIVNNERKFNLTDAEFNKIRQIIKDLTGISMGDSKRQLIYRRLSGRLAALNCRSFNDYIALLRGGEEKEIEIFSNAVTTNLTSFFRESHHFEFLQETILPQITEQQINQNKRLRVWSAGCSTGEEPYSIAISLYESIPDMASWDIKILCTDLDSDVLSMCREGKYALERVEKIPQTQLHRWFSIGKNEHKNFVRVKKKLQDIITFKQLNLMGPWPMRGPFDVIFCRNVIIYFDKPTQRILVDRYAELLGEGGYLILGHSESLLNVTDRFKLVGKTVYRKVY